MESESQEQIKEKADCWHVQAGGPWPPTSFPSCVQATHTHTQIGFTRFYGGKTNQTKPFSPTKISTARHCKCWRRRDEEYNESYGATVGNGVKTRKQKIIF